jgi:hypothetical protein
MESPKSIRFSRRALGWGAGSSPNLTPYSLRRSTMGHSVDMVCHSVSFGLGPPCHRPGISPYGHAGSAQLNRRHCSACHDEAPELLPDGGTLAGTPMQSFILVDIILSSLIGRNAAFRTGLRASGTHPRDA